MQDKMKKGKVSRTFGKALIFIVFFFFAGCGSADTEENGIEEITLTDEGTEETAEKDETSENNGEEQADAAEQTVFVYVCGEVRSPGVYELRADARVFEAISSAGGITEEAAPDAVNQARVIVDGEQIYVPTVEEAASQTAGVGETTGTKSKYKYSRKRGTYDSDRDRRSEGGRYPEIPGRAWQFREYRRADADQRDQGRRI